MPVSVWIAPAVVLRMGYRGPGSTRCPVGPPPRPGSGPARARVRAEGRSQKRRTWRQSPAPPRGRRMLEVDRDVALVAQQVVPPPDSWGCVPTHRAVVGSRRLEGDHVRAEIAEQLRPIATDVRSRHPYPGERAGRRPAATGDSALDTAEVGARTAAATVAPRRATPRVSPNAGGHR